ncbi:unnamed protein product [Amoebophrya sp. A120]|nr:unnamed protein product [Amoebophrya sp. A120]|eukprot:GSA120T00009453001.1
MAVLELAIRRPDFSFLVNAEFANTTADDGTNGNTNDNKAGGTSSDANATAGPKVDLIAQLGTKLEFYTTYHKSLETVLEVCRAFSKNKQSAEKKDLCFQTYKKHMENFFFPDPVVLATGDRAAVEAEMERKMPFLERGITAITNDIEKKFGRLLLQQMVTSGSVPDAVAALYHELKQSATNAVAGEMKNVSAPEKCGRATDLSNKTTDSAPGEENYAERTASSGSSGSSASFSTAARQQDGESEGAAAGVVSANKQGDDSGVRLGLQYTAKELVSRMDNLVEQNRASASQQVHQCAAQHHPDPLLDLNIMQNVLSRMEKHARDKAKQRQSKHAHLRDKKQVKQQRQHDQELQKWEIAAKIASGNQECLFGWHDICTNFYMDSLGGCNVNLEFLLRRLLPYNIKTTQTVSTMHLNAIKNNLVTLATGQPPLKKKLLIDCDRTTGRIARREVFEPSKTFAIVDSTIKQLKHLKAFQFLKQLFKMLLTWLADTNKYLDGMREVVKAIGLPTKQKTGEYVTGVIPGSPEDMRLKQLGFKHPTNANLYTPIDHEKSKVGLDFVSCMKQLIDENPFEQAMKLFGLATEIETLDWNRMLSPGGDEEYNAENINSSSLADDAFISEEIEDEAENSCTPAAGSGSSSFSPGAEGDENGVKVKHRRVRIQFDEEKMRQFKAKQVNAFLSIVERLDWYRISHAEKQLEEDNKARVMKMNAGAASTPQSRGVDQHSGKDSSVGGKNKKKSCNNSTAPNGTSSADLKNMFDPSSTSGGPQHLLPATPTAAAAAAQSRGHVAPRRVSAGRKCLALVPHSYVGLHDELSAVSDLTGMGGRVQKQEKAEEQRQRDESAGAGAHQDKNFSMEPGQQSFTRETTPGDHDQDQNEMEDIEREIREREEEIRQRYPDPMDDVDLDFFIGTTEFKSPDTGHWFFRTEAGRHFMVPEGRLFEMVEQPEEGGAGPGAERSP